MSEQEVEAVVLVQRQDELIGRMAGELERLGKGVERIAAKYGADHPEVADALHRLLRGRG